MPKSLTQLQQELHETHKAKGWSEINYTPLEMHMRIVGEIAEASACVCNGEKPWHFKNGKPEGEAAELTDGLITILNYFSEMGWSAEELIESKHKYNKTRPHLHGGKLK